MLIPLATLRAIVAGEVTLAFRRWDRPRVRGGGRVDPDPVGRDGPCVARGAMDAAFPGDDRAPAGGAGAGSGGVDRSRKDSNQAIRFTKNARFKVLDNGKLRLPKVGDLAVRWSRSLPSDPSSLAVIRDAAGRDFASFVVQTTDVPLPEADCEVGIDLGLTHFAVLSDGTKVVGPRFLRSAARKLKRLQQALARKQKGSANRSKVVRKVARAHARVADTRRDWQHKLSTAIIRDNQAVYVEDLCIVGLGRTRLAKSVYDAGWAGFTAMLEDKAARHGRTFGKVDRFFPSTRMCSACGRINAKVALDVRSWDCPCGAIHDRDVNAAKNVKAAGQADFNDRGARVRPGLVPAPRGEAVTHPGAARSTRGVEGISVLKAERMSTTFYSNSTRTVVVGEKFEDCNGSTTMWGVRSPYSTFSENPC